MATTSIQSLRLSVTGLSKSTWHSKDSTPDTKPNRPMAALGKNGTRCVSSE